MLIKPTDEKGRYMVASESNPDREYLVDISPTIDSYGCSCNSFRYKCAPVFEKGGAPYKENTSCKHIKFVCDWLFNQIMEDSFKNES